MSNGENEAPAKRYGWAAIERAARALCAHDLATDIDEDTWDDAVPEADRNDYRRQARRIAAVLEALDPAKN